MMNGPGPARNRMVEKLGQSVTKKGRTPAPKPAGKKTQAGTKGPAGDKATSLQQLPTDPPPYPRNIADGGDGSLTNDNDYSESGKDDRDRQYSSGSDDLDSGSRPLRRPKTWRSRRGQRSVSRESSMSRSSEKKSVLAALLPGSEIKDGSDTILVNTATSNETVKFNVGGTIFETHRSTLHKLPNSPLADDSFMEKHFRLDKREYFFDRDPEVFGAVLNYLRTGELHLPTKYCGPAVKNEMEFWNIEEDEIEECCWTNYSAWTTTLEALRKLEKDRKVHMPGSIDQFMRPGQRQLSRLRQFQMKAWDVLNSPHTNTTAQIYSYISLTFVVISIFSFIAQTHDFFRVPITEGRYPEPAPPTNRTYNATNATLPSTTLTSTTTASATDPENTTRSEVHPAMMYIDIVCLVFFLSEFLLRFVLSPRRCKLMLLPMTVFELLALLPDLIEFGFRIFNPSLGVVTGIDVITFLRLLRVFRIFRLMRHFPGLWILFYTLKASVKELLLLLLFLCVGMLFFASLIYYTDDRKTFTSIPLACWWSIITMTTVGYGDMHPSTELGYVVGSMTAICGVLVIGFTVPVLVNNFILYYHHTQCAINREDAKAKRAAVKEEMRLNVAQATARSGLALVNPQHYVSLLKDSGKNAEVAKSNPNLISLKDLRGKEDSGLTGNGDGPGEKKRGSKGSNGSLPCV